MEVLYDTKSAMCPAEPDHLASADCSDGCELLTGEVCEASWWDGLLNGCEGEGPGAEMSEGQQADACLGSKWSGDSRLDEFCPFDTDLGAIHSDGMIPCMADELEQFSEHLTLSLPCSPDTPASGIQNSLSSSNVSTLSGALSGGKVPVPVLIDAQTPAVMEAAEAAADAAEAPTASPYRGVLTNMTMNQRPLKGEEEEGEILSPSTRALRMKLPQSLRNAVAIRDGCSPPFTGAWRGCIKSSWCNRENRHRGVCNTRAEVPGLAAYAEEELAAQGVCGADFPGHWPLQGVKEEQPGCEDLNDSEQASATEVLLEHACEPDAQCLDSGVPRCRQIRLDGQGVISDGQGQNRTRLRLVVKRQQRQATAAAGSPPGGPPTPELPAPLFASQDSSDSADSNTQRETDSSSQETGATDADEVRCTAHAHRSPPSKAELAAAKTSERPRRASPSTPDICAQRPASKPTPESLERSMQALARESQEALGSPFAASPPLPQVHSRGSPPSGCVQTSSGRIARPTPKTAASRASSADLSELSHTEGHTAPAKRKSGRPAKGGEKAKRRRMVGGILKHVGHAAPGQQCTQCGTQVTPVWRAGPYGPKTLCNACGVRYMKQVKKK